MDGYYQSYYSCNNDSNIDRTFRVCPNILLYNHDSYCHEYIYITYHHSAIIDDLKYIVWYGVLYAGTQLIAIIVLSMNARNAKVSRSMMPDRVCLITQVMLICICHVHHTVPALQYVFDFFAQFRTHSSNTKGNMPNT